MERIIKFYKTGNEKCPVEEFLDSLIEPQQIKILSVFKLVQELKVIPRKFFKKLTGTQLFEIRIEWKSDIFRFPCFFEKDKLVILTHGFQKKTMKTPKKEIDKAESYYQEYKRRNK